MEGPIPELFAAALGGLLLSEASGEAVVVSAVDMALALLSLTILIAARRVARGRSVFGSAHGRRLNWTTFVVGMFLAAMVYSWGFAAQELVLSLSPLRKT